VSTRSQLLLLTKVTSTLLAAVSGIVSPALCPDAAGVRDGLDSATIPAVWALWPKAAEAVLGKPNRTTALLPTAPKNLTVLFIVTPSVLSPVWTTASSAAAGRYISAPRDSAAVRLQDCKPARSSVTPASRQRHRCLGAANRVTTLTVEGSGEGLRLRSRWAVGFDRLASQTLRRGSFPTVADLMPTIQRFMDPWNDRCAPFTSTPGSRHRLRKATDPRRRKT
jgi:hypothetical protein